MTADDILLSGVCSGPREALELYAESLSDSSDYWRTQAFSERWIGETAWTVACPTCDPVRFSAEYREDAQVVRSLLRGMTGNGSPELFQRWVTSKDPLIAHIGETLLSEKYHKLPTRH